MKLSTPSLAQFCANLSRLLLPARLHACKEWAFFARGGLPAGDTSPSLDLGGDAVGASSSCKGRNGIARLGLTDLIHIVLPFCSVPLHGGDRGSRTSRGWQRLLYLPAGIPVNQFPCLLLAEVQGVDLGA